jgi:hypothetical protein
MTTSLRNGLPDTLQKVQTRPLFVMRLDVRPLQIIGATPGAYRRVGVVPSGVFEGEHLSGQVLDGGVDWQTVRGDGSTTLDVRLVLADGLLAEHWDVLQDEATKAESRSGLPMFGTKFPG